MHRADMQRAALLKPPGTQRKIRDRLLICELLMRLAWVKKLPHPSAACEAIAPHVVGSIRYCSWHILRSTSGGWHGT